MKLKFPFHSKKTQQLIFDTLLDSFAEKTIRIKTKKLIPCLKKLLSLS